MSSMASRMIRSFPTSLNLPGIQQHDAPADAGKIVFHLIVIKGCLLGQDVFQQFAQFGDVPLFIAQVIDQLPHGLSWLTLKTS